MRTPRVLWLPVVAVLSGGCFQATTILNVNADGSGTIHNRLLVTDAAIDRLRGFTIMSGGNADAVDPLSEQQARALASAIGPGVTYVSSTPIKTETAQGRDATYAFTDITKLRISEQPPVPGGVSVRAQGVNTASDPITFAMTRQPDQTASLRIMIPHPNVLPIGLGTPPGGAPAGNPDQVAMLQQLLAGARLTVAVEPNGHVVRSSSPYVDGDRVTLIDVDMDQVLKDPSVLAKLRAATTVDEAKAIVAGVPGLKLNLDPEITIDFTPAK